MALRHLNAWFRPLFEDFDKHILPSPIQSFWDTINPFQLAIDVFLVLFVLYILNRKSYKPEKPLSKQEIEQLITEWEPIPLHPTLTAEQKLNLKTPTVTSSTVTHVTVEGVEGEVLNLARANFLGMIGNPKVEDSARGAVYKYGTGTCGPRGFYGTLDVHLELEARIKKFMQVEDTIIYSYGFATVSSTIPSFAGRGDILVADKGVSYSLATGIKLSRSEVHWFEHNDMQDLERILEEIRRKDVATQRKLSRRFIVVEGLYPNYGDIVNLPELMRLKNKYCYRIVLDESFSVGTLGKTGRGVTEHFNIPIRSIELITGDLASTVGSVGGFCLGSTAIVYHQRLNGPGYVYSASLPALLTRAATTAFDILDEDPQLIVALHTSLKQLYNGLNRIAGLKVTSREESAVVLVELAHSTGSRIGDDTVLQAMVDRALTMGLLISRAKYVAAQEKFLPPPSLRLYASSAFTEAHIKRALEVLTHCAAECIPQISRRSEEAVATDGVSQQPNGEATGARRRAAKTT